MGSEWSVTVTKNLRITFTFQDGDAYNVNVAIFSPNSFYSG